MVSLELNFNLINPKISTNLTKFPSVMCHIFQGGSLNENSKFSQKKSTKLKNVDFEN